MEAALSSQKHVISSFERLCAGYEGPPTLEFFSPIAGTAIVLKFSNGSSINFLSFRLKVAFPGARAKELRSLERRRLAANSPSEAQETGYA
jgi:hypothetical protein